MGFSETGEVSSTPIVSVPSFFFSTFVLGSVSVLRTVFPLPSVKSVAPEEPIRKTVKNIVTKYFSVFALDSKETVILPKGYFINSF